MNAFSRRGACPALTAPMLTGDGLLVRLNPVAGGLSPATLAGLCHSAARHGNGIVEVTARGSIQIRGLTPASARLLADDVDALGVAVRTGVPVETGPLAGLDPDEIADPRPVAEAIRQAVGDAGLSALLGPKVSVIVDGGGRFSMDDLLADVRLTAVERDGQTLWRLAVGGLASSARVIGEFPGPQAAEEVVALLQSIARLGREARGRDLWPRQPAPSPERRPRLATLGIFALSDFTHAFGIALPFGSMPASALAAFAQQAAALGIREIRPAPGRILLAIGPSAESCIRLQREAASLGFVCDPADPRLHIAACPGSPACASARLETRALAQAVAQDHADLLDGSLVFHVSGCAKGCAHPRPAALTVVGGENGTGLVAGGTAQALPGGYTPRYEAAKALGRIAMLVASARLPGETAAACLHRLGPEAVATAFARDRE
jgi:precorrin-3B synthase